ncbi:hypothetical protein, partial [Brucella anthropi]|uniref:hypothetical protein n=1 Tax=Brucella anthropi TaxID=529 RepID=UPI00244C6463
AFSKRKSLNLLARKLSQTVSCSLGMASINIQPLHKRRKSLDYFVRVFFASSELTPVCNKRPGRSASKNRNSVATFTEKIIATEYVGASAL